MLKVKFYDWKKKRPKKHYLLVHEIRIFELIFSKKVSEFEMGLREIENVTVFCLANENTDISYEVNRALGEIRVYVPYDFMDFLTLNSVEEKYKEFCKLYANMLSLDLKKILSFHPLLLKGIQKNL